MGTQLFCEIYPISFSLDLKLIIVLCIQCPEVAKFFGGNVIEKKTGDTSIPCSV